VTLQERQQLHAGGDLPHHPDVAVHLKELPDPFPAQGVVIGDHDVDPHALVHRPNGAPA